MGDGEKASLRLQFNPKVRLAFHGATITTDAGLLAFREFDDALGLTEIAEDYLQESRTGRNILHHLVPLLRQSIYPALPSRYQGCIRLKERRQICRRTGSHFNDHHPTSPLSGRYGCNLPKPLPNRVAAPQPIANKVVLDWSRIN